jgi:hypothetical protein
MKRLVIALLICATAGSAYAQQQPATPRNPSCTSEATDKKLAGAAKTSFMKKCETDSTAACDAAATDKKLSGVSSGAAHRKSPNET